MNSKTRVLIADDHPIVRKGFVSIIEDDPNFTVVAECNDGVQAQRQIALHKPHIAVLDISMPDMSGLDVVRWARSRKHTMKFLILTMYAEHQYLDAALKLGVNGYILKESAVHELVSCLKAVTGGRDYISPSLAAKHIKSRTNLQTFHHFSALNTLTPTERHVVKYIGQNLTSRQIALQLNVSFRTIQNHRFNICQKLGFKGHHRLLQFALEHRSELAG